MKALKDKNYIERVGADKNGYWKIIEVMKILILNTSELTGGAAVAANRLAKHWVNLV